MMLYISADGVKNNFKSENGALFFRVAYILIFVGFTGGVSLLSSTIRKNSNADTQSEQTALPNCLHPEDLIPFTRKPLFTIVDSNNSHAYKNVKSVFGKPFVCLLSPHQNPTSIKGTSFGFWRLRFICDVDYSQIGSLFTMFLHSPLKALLHITEQTQLPAEKFEALKTAVQQVEKAIHDLFESKVGTFGT